MLGGHLASGDRSEGFGPPIARYLAERLGLSPFRSCLGTDARATVVRSPEREGSNQVQPGVLGPEGSIELRRCTDLGPTGGERKPPRPRTIPGSGVLDMKKVFTTGQVAKICKVAPRTVSKWFDSGRLRGYRIPGSQDRRIPREHLLRFLKEHGMPLGDLEAEVYHKILVVGADSPMLSNLREHLREGDDFRIETAASGFEAGIRAESFHPDCIIIDLAVGRIEAGQIAQNLRKSQDHLTTILIALTSDEPTEDIYNLGFNDAFKKPFDGALLAERVRRLISQKKADEP